MKKLLVICTLTIFLAGCWDEVLYKEVTIVPLIGIEDQEDKVHAYFSFPSVIEGQIEYSKVEGHGISLRTARNNAFLKSDELLDVSQLETLLMSSETAKEGVIKYIDPVYRTPRNRLNGRTVIVMDELETHFENLEKLPEEPPDFYRGLLQTAIEFANIPNYNMQKMMRILKDEGQDLTLPAIGYSDEEGIPEIIGTALFNDANYSGVYLTIEESKYFILLCNLANKKYLQFSFLFEDDGEFYPLDIEYDGHKEKISIEDNTIIHHIQLKAAVEEFPHDHLKEKSVVEELNRFLSKVQTDEAQAVMKKMQDVKSDAVGYGKKIRAFYPEIWNRGKWSDTFSEMDIQIKIDVEIIRTGILG